MERFGVDPELADTLDDLPSTDLDATTLADWRALPSGSPSPLPPPAPALQRRHVPGLPGEPEVEIVLVDPSPGRQGRGAFMHIHGGGYVLFAAARDPVALQKLAMDDDIVIVAVDYRLAPETPFPGALNDNYAALLWLYRQADALGVDRDRIAVGGESAGGGHAAALAIAARDRGEIPIAFQSLLYPMLDDRVGSGVGPVAQIGRHVWTRASNHFGWSSHLGRLAGEAEVPALAVPARVAELSDLPPAFIGCGGLDLFIDENIAYAQRLIAAGVPTELLVVPGAYHGFDLAAPQAGVSRRFTAAWRSALRRAIADPQRARIGDT